jgi:capsular polysaccharide biosynthesis protein
MTRLPTVLRPLFPLAKAGYVAATRVVSPVTRRLPGLLHRPGPPRHVALSAATYAAANPAAGVSVVEVEPRITMLRERPLGRPAGYWVFESFLREVVEPNVVCRIPGGRVIETYGAIVTADDTLLYDLSPYYDVGRATAHPIFLRLGLPAVHHVAGSVGVLTTRGIENYYHFLTDVLPRLALLERAGVTPDAFVVSRQTRFQREMLDHLGIEASRCIESTEFRHVEADELIVPSVPDGDLRTPPWIVPWLRRHFLPADLVPSPTRLLYVTRGNQRYTRRVENEDALMGMLAPRGFELIDPGAMSVAEQVDAFSNARCIVSAHGAGLTNLAFCTPGAAVIEMFAADYVNPCFWRLACAVEGLQYGYVVGDGSPTNVRSNRGVASDVRANIAQVTALLNEVL